MTPMQVMEMPLAMFWSANKQIDRLRAEVNMRDLQIALSAAAPESAKELHEALRQEVGTPALVIRGFDEARYLEMQEKYSTQRE